MGVSKDYDYRTAREVVKEKTKPIETFVPTLK